MWSAETCTSSSQSGFFSFFSPHSSFCSCLDPGRVWSPRTPLQGGRSSWKQHEDSGQSVARSRRLEPRRSPSAVAPEAPSHGPAQRAAGRRASSGSAPFAFPPAGAQSYSFVSSWFMCSVSRNKGPLLSFSSSHTPDLINPAITTSIFSPYTSTPLLYGLGGVSEWGKGRGAAARRPPGCCVPDGNLKPGASPPNTPSLPLGRRGLVN